MLNCFECGIKTKKLTRFMCMKCYYIKYMKKEIKIKPTKSNWICDCSPPEPDLHPFIEKKCERCLKIKPNKKQ